MKLTSAGEFMETLEEKVVRVTKEEITVEPYDPRWPGMFERERLHLSACLPANLIVRIEHFGSTSIPDIDAKPVVDILIEVTNLDETRKRIAPILEAQGYDYFWRASFGNDTPPFYCWFIKRDATGKRTHHIHMITADFEQWDNLLFRDYLIEHPAVAGEYGDLKRRLAAHHRFDREAYTSAKSEFIRSVTEKAKRYYTET